MNPSRGLFINSKLLTMKKIIKKLELGKETVSYLNQQPNEADAKLLALKGGLDPYNESPYISKTRGTIYNCPSYPFHC